MTRSGEVLSRLFVMGCLVFAAGIVGCSDDNKETSEESSTSAPNSSGGLTGIQDRLNQAEPGAFIVVEDSELVGTLIIPPGVNVAGIEGSELVIRPEPGEPGIVMLGEGISGVSHMRIEAAGGAGIQIEERAVTLDNIIVSDTQINDDLPGHGIDVRNAPSFEARRVSSNNNAGTGLNVEGTNNVVIIHPQFIPAPADFIGNAAKVIIHPQFLEGQESQAIIHPQFQPEDEDSIIIIHPQFMDEEDYAIIIHPQAFEGSTFNENGGNGISIIHPQFSDENNATTASILTASGFASSGNQESGLVIDGSNNANINQAILTGNGSGDISSSAISIHESTCSMDSLYVANNEGPGAQIVNSALIIGTEKNQTSPRITGSEADGLSIIHPQFLPSTTFSGNEGALLLTGSELTQELGGKADSPWGNMLILNGAMIEGNESFGIQNECTSMQLKNSIISGTKTNKTGKQGGGIVLGANSACDGNPGTLEMDAGSVVSENEGTGILLRNGSHGTIRGLVQSNEKGGIIASMENTTLVLQGMNASEQGADCTDVTCAAPTVHNNQVVGVAITKQASLFADGALISGTQDREIIWESIQEAPMTFGDGILAVHASTLTVMNSTVKDNARAGLIIVDEPETPQAEMGINIIINSSFENSVYGAMRIAHDMDTDKMITPEILANLPSPSYWSGMMTSCAAVGNTHAWVNHGCLPFPKIDCDMNDANCGGITPCGACSLACDNTPENCNIVSCECPSNAECCSYLECLPKDTDPEDCETLTCGVDWTCEVATIQDCDPEVSPSTGGGQENPCIGDEDCAIIADPECGVYLCIYGECQLEPSEVNCDDGLGCTIDTCSDAGVCQNTSNCDDGLECTDDLCEQEGCEFVLKSTHCLIVNDQGVDFCTEEGDLKPGSQCEACSPINSQADWTELTNSPCDDSNKCTVNDICGTTGCKGTDKLCSSDTSCLQSTCNPVNGECLSTPITTGTDCNDGNPCTVYEKCNAGDCVGGINPCDDGNSCTINVCNPDDDDDRYSCAHELLAKGTICDDGDPCSLESSCNNVGSCLATILQECNEDTGNLCTEYGCELGLCELVETPGCCETNADCDDGVDDGYSCTADVCENNVCVPENHENSLCPDDGNDCTLNKCAPGAPESDIVTGCKYIPKDNLCSDADPCTNATCDSDAGCIYTEICCDDGLVCTNDACLNGGCLNSIDDDFCLIATQNAQGGQTPTCYSGGTNSQENQCDICEPANSQINWTQTENNPCDDGNACTSGESCNATLGCQGGSSITCDDGNICTTDFCNTTTGCTFTAIECDDGNVCTTDSCDPVSGCIGSPDICDDGLPCTSDTCADIAGTAACSTLELNSNCDDGIACTLDECSKNNPDADDDGCVFVPQNALCSDGDDCTLDTCDLDFGGCLSIAFTCVEDDPCTEVTCGESNTLDCVETPAQDGTSCDDGVECTLDLCGDGECVSQPDDDQCPGLQICDVNNGCVGVECTGDLNCESDDPCKVPTCELDGTCAETDTSGTSGDCEGNGCPFEVAAALFADGNTTHICVTNWCTWREVNFDDSTCSDSSSPGCVEYAGTSYCDSLNSGGPTEEGGAQGDLNSIESIVCSTNEECQDEDPDDADCVDYFCDLTTNTCKHNSNDSYCNSGGSGCPTYECVVKSESGLGSCELSSSSDAACDDGIPCTVDSCEDSGCLNEPQDNLCSDSQICDASIGCTAASAPSSSLECYSDSQCQTGCGTGGTCVQVYGTGQCQYDVIASEGTPCTNFLAGSCEYGACEANGGCAITTTSYTAGFCETVGCAYETAVSEYNAEGTGDCYTAWCSAYDNGLLDSGQSQCLSAPSGAECSEYQLVGALCP